MQPNSSKFAVAAAVVAVVIAAISVWISLGGSAPRSGNSTASYWSATYFTTTDTATDSVLKGGVQVGSSGSSIGRINTGFCNIQANSNTIAASTTKQVDCVNVAGTPPGTALTGIIAGDKCILGQSTTTPSTSNGVIVAGASASSTAGFITAILSNLTGATFTWTAAASSSLPYVCFGA